MAEASTSSGATPSAEPRRSEGNERPFPTNQFVISPTATRRVGTFTAGPEHFLEWKDCAPTSRDALAQKLGKTVAELTGQELMVAGMLTPATLSTWCVTSRCSPRLADAVKIGRYQQYRAF
jgi:type I restriction enzyme R subunit